MNVSHTNNNISDLTNVTRNVKNTYAVGATIISPTLMFLAGVGSNILALTILYRRRCDLRTVKFYILAKGLVWTDLLGIIFTTPSVVAAYVNRGWTGGNVHCSFHGFTMTCFGLATPLIICAMAIERFMAVKCVFFYSSRCKNEIAKRCIVLIWMFVVGFGILPFIGVGLFTKQYPGTWCFLDFHSHNILVKIYPFLYACINIILILLMIVCNSFVVCCLAQRRFLRKQKRRRFVSTMASMTTMENEALTVSSQQKQKKRSMDVEIYSIIFLFALSLVFAICWGPFMIQILRTLITEEADVILDIAAVNKRHVI
ncbi:PE2R4-like protein [Mya arenaria]|uniref:Thromboxane A2 receptor n=1 Tax=Mya arenaria TaxID=6604 RepID=A0ABY7FQ77_MYAAR|nr:PE2R4-like protein [Mya arenaria]